MALDKSAAMTEHRDIRIGTLSPIDPAYLGHIVGHGFESFELTCSGTANLDLPELAKKCKDAVGGAAIISSIGIYANPLQSDEAVRGWEQLIDVAHLFGATVVCGFAGALEDRPVDESIPKFKEVFGDLARRAADKGLKVAFENCDMGGTWSAPKWNIAHSPRAWEMMFDAVAGDTLGLEWEPCHQMVSLIDPLPQLRKYIGRVYHVHGKDASVDWAGIRTEGIRSGRTQVWHRTPGFGDTNWTDVISILRMGGFTGAIDIEGWHDPVYRGEMEMTGQVHSLRYLQACRGGEYIPNPLSSK